MKIHLDEAEEYGFPKDLPAHVRPEDLETWLLEEGYPKEVLYSSEKSAQFYLNPSQETDEY